MAGLFVPNLTAEQIANARKWIAALRSGEYRQGAHRVTFLQISDVIEEELALVTEGTA